jgi:hypothetical protein
MLHARGIINPPYFSDAGFDDLVQRGLAHEKTILHGFRDRGLHVVEIPPSHGDVNGGIAAPAAAMSTGADVIYQAVLTGEAEPGDVSTLLGFPDFLLRAELISAPDGEPRADADHAMYEVVDAKLARTAKGRAVAQTAFYSQLLADLQGAAPRGCTWRLALANGPRPRSPTSPHTSGRPRGSLPSSSTRTPRRTNPPTPIPSRWNTARFAGGVPRARPGGAQTTTCPSSQASRRFSGDG